MAAIILQWQTRHPAMRVDVFILGKDGEARTLVGDDRTGGQAQLSLPDTAGPDPRFYLVVDGGPKDSKTDGLDARARLLPLEHASNFRDLGGYVAEDGRTGIASALILSSLGVSRDQIMRDYQMSTKLRQPRYEMPPIDLAQYPDNPVAKFFAGANEKPPQPLYGEDGISLLAATFDMIDERWGSVNGFLHQVIGLTDADIARLKGLYLE